MADESAELPGRRPKSFETDSMGYTVDNKTDAELQRDNVTEVEQRSGQGQRGRGAVDAAVSSSASSSLACDGENKPTSGRSVPPIPDHVRGIGEAEWKSMTGREREKLMKGSKRRRGGQFLEYYDLYYQPMKFKLGRQ